MTLLVAALVVRHSLPKPVAITAEILAAMMLLPITTWIAAIVVPVWLGAAGATVRSR